MTFGMYSGVRLSDLPESYLEWSVTTSRYVSDDLRREMRAELNRRWFGPLDYTRDDE